MIDENDVKFKFSCHWNTAVFTHLIIAYGHLVIQQ
jgi:hypothetical protein